MLSEKTKKWLSENLDAQAVRFDEPMSRHTSLRVGGPADALVAPASKTELLRLMDWLMESRTAFKVFGDGTNLLIPDKGLRDVVVLLQRCLCHLQLGDDTQEPNSVFAGAGARMGSLCRFAVSNALAGASFAVGIPGTVGGAVVMNAGTRIGSIADILVLLEVWIPSGEVLRTHSQKEWFSYRTSNFPAEWSAEGRKPILLEAGFKLHAGDTAILQQEMESIWRQRRETQPYDKWSAGSFFKNPPGGKTAGELIDLAGLKDLRQGGAAVSKKHANFIINTGGATASDILALMNRIQETVDRKFGVHLEPEIHIEEVTE